MQHQNNQQEFEPNQKDTVSITNNFIFAKTTKITVWCGGAVSEYQFLIQHQISVFINLVFSRIFTVHTKKANAYPFWISLQKENHTNIFFTKQELDFICPEPAISIIASLTNLVPEVIGQLR